MAWSLRKFLSQARVLSSDPLEKPASRPLRSGDLTGVLATTYLLRNPEVITQRAENETILFCMSSGQYYSLNEVGTRVWELFDGAHTASAIIAQLEGEYEAAHTTISEDVLFLTSELSGNGLLVDGGGRKSEA